MAEQDLKLNIKAQGGDKAAGEVAKVTDAQAKLGKATGSTAKPTKQLTDQQKKLNAAESDYVGLLTQINPALGAFVDGGLKALKITGDLANKNINLKKAFASATAAIKKNANALKLIGAAGAAAIAITLLVTAYRKLKEEAEAATEAMRKNEEQINKFKASQRDRQQTIEDVAGKRRGGGLTAEQSQEANRTAEILGDRLPSISEQIINEVVGALAGSGLSVDQLGKAAILQQQGRLGLNDQSSLSGNVARVESAIRRFGDQLETFRTREETQEREVASEAISAAGSAGGAPESIQEFIKNLPGPERSEEDVEQLAEVLQLIRKGGATNRNEALLQFSRTVPQFQLLLEEAKAILKLLESVTQKQPADTTATTDATRSLADAMHDLTEAMRQVSSRASTTVIEAPNATFNGPAATRHDLTVNGETELDAIRGGF